MNKNAIARYDKAKKKWSVSEGDVMASFNRCILSGCTVEISEDAQSIEDIVFYGSHFQNPKAVKLEDPIAIMFNAKAKRFEDSKRNEIVLDGTKHVRCFKKGRLFLVSEKIVLK